MFSPIGFPVRPYKAVYSLDLVALMAGGRFQETANLFVERMDAYAHAHRQTETKLAPPSSTTTRPSSEVKVDSLHAEMAAYHAPSTAISAMLTQTRVNIPAKPCLKKSRPSFSTEEEASKPSHGEIRRIRMPSLDTFQRQYMETATPVILTGVSTPS